MGGRGGEGMSARHGLRPLPLETNSGSAPEPAYLSNSLHEYLLTTKSTISFSLTTAPATLFILSASEI